MKPITLTLTIDQVQLIVNALAELPYKVAESTINNIRAQVTSQIEEKSAEANETVPAQE